ncbi:MAG: hypothetical protein H6Q04_1911 [Acidobacteria bacterium]|jgi:hypothetical protein|nr:hypothetical protein [Acidobacteriota bacterium]
MNDSKKFDEPAVYQIRLKGILDPSWSDWFDNFSITTQEDETLLVGPVSDQAALHGILTKINGLGLAITAITQVEGARDENN